MQNAAATLMKPNVWALWQVQLKGLKWRWKHFLSLVPASWQTGNLWTLCAGSYMQCLEELSHPLLSQGFTAVSPHSYTTLSSCRWFTMMHIRWLNEAWSETVLLDLVWNELPHTPGKDVDMCGERAQLIYLQMHPSEGGSEGEMTSLRLIHHMHFVKVIFKVTATSELTPTHQFIMVMDKQLVWEHSGQLLMFLLCPLCLSPCTRMLMIFYCYYYFYSSCILWQSPDVSFDSAVKANGVKCQERPMLFPKINACKMWVSSSHKQTAYRQRRSINRETLTC